jgi:hypothetical protein
MNMPRVPTTVQDLLNFCSEHGVVWTAIPTPGSIGLTAAMITAFKTATGDAVTAVTAQSAAKDTAKASTIGANTKVKALRTSVAAMIRAITTYAAAQADPNIVYQNAQIDPPSPRTPSEPPGQPTNITATLDDEGNITLKWKCNNPAGGNVIYTISRRENATGDFQQIGVAGSRAFLDDSIPVGSGTVQYVIRGFRGQTVGEASAIFTLLFGHGDGLSFGEAKLAA